MATVVTKTVKPSGGDYISITAALQAEDDIRSNLVTRDEILVIECYKGDYSAVGGGVNYTDETVVVTGFTTDATRYIKITVPESERHNGKVKDGDGNYTGFTVIASASKTLFTISETYTEVEGLILASETLYASGMTASYNTGNYANIHHCLFYNFGNSNRAYCSFIAGDYTYGYFWNNIAILSKCRISNTSTSARWWYFYNNTFFDSAFDGGNDGVCRAINNLVYVSFAENCYTGTFHANSDYNISADNDATDATAPGANSLTNKSLANCAFVSTAYNNSQDVHITADSIAVGSGLDVSSGYTLVVTNDIDSETRSAWDIGADEYASASTNISITVPTTNVTATAITPSITAEGEVNVIVSTLATIITVNGISPNVFTEQNTTVIPPPAEATSAGNVPSIETTKTVNIVSPTAQADSIGIVPAVTTTTNVTVITTVAEVTAEGIVPTIESITNKTIGAPYAESQANGITPTITATETVGILSPTATVTAEGIEPLIEYTQSVTINTAAGEVTAECIAPNIISETIGNVSILTPIVNVSIDGISPTITTGMTTNVSIESPIAEVVSEGITTSIQTDANITANIAMATAEAESPVIVSGESVSIIVAHASAVTTGESPSVTTTETVNIEAPIAQADSEGIALTITAVTTNVIIITPIANSNANGESVLVDAVITERVRRKLLLSMAYGINVTKLRQKNRTKKAW